MSEKKVSIADIRKRSLFRDLAEALDADLQEQPAADERPTVLVLADGIAALTELHNRMGRDHFQKTSPQRKTIRAALSVLLEWERAR